MTHAPDDTKPIKVQIPVRQHIKLHSLRIVTDLGLSEMVQIAVANYLDLVKEEGDVDIDRMALEDQELGG